MLDHAIVYMLLLTVTFSSTEHSECIVAFALHQWLCEHGTMLRFKYIAYLVNIGIFCKNLAQSFNFQPHLSIT